MTSFFKMTGSGNDFVMLDGRETSIDQWPAERIRSVCDRRYGVGGDGLVILTPRGPETVRMDYFNADGSDADMCGNAALCSTRLSARLKLVASSAMTLETRAGAVHSRVLGGPEMAEIRLPDCRVPAPVAGLEPGPGEDSLRLGVVGVPHLVVRVQDVDQVDLDHRGRELRWDRRLGPAGANANFMSPPNGASGGRWRIRTFERGVEGETLACGTGTATAGLDLLVSGDAESPVPFVSRGGDPLEVRARIDGEWARDLWLAGQGRLVFTGDLAS